MRRRLATRSTFLPSGALLRAAIPLITLITAVASAQSGNPKSRVVYLPDPTPRETDPHLLLKDNPQAGASTQEALERRNEKRRELVLWAADELVTLSERLNAQASQPKTAASTTEAAANAQKIEQLAKNLAAALKVP